MKRKWYPSLMMIMVFLNLAQGQKIIKGHVHNESGKPIPFATIGIINKNIGTYSFEDGSFSLSSFRISTEDSLTVSHIGYQTVIVSYTEGDQKIVLKEKETILEEVIVRPGITERFGLFKKKSASSIAVDLPFNGAEVGTIIQLPEGLYVVKQLMVNALSNNVDSLKIRARIYTVRENKPAELLHQTKVFVFGKINGNIMLDLDEPLKVSGSIFLSFEWLVNRQTAGEISNLYQHKKVVIDSIKNHHKGSVNIYNNNKVEVLDKNGATISEFKLDKSATNKLKYLAEVTPKVRFRTTKKRGYTYYRSHSLGKWFPYQQSLIAGIEISPSSKK